MCPCPNRYVRFLKAQCKDWLKNVVNLLIFRLNAPVWSARRGVTQMLTQEYEGRGVDVTIMPWVRPGDTQSSTR